MKAKPTVKLEILSPVGAQVFWCFTRKSARHLAKKFHQRDCEILLDGERIFQSEERMLAEAATAARQQLLERSPLP